LGSRRMRTPTKLPAIGDMKIGASHGRSSALTMRYQSWCLASDVVRNFGLDKDEARQLDEEITGANYYQDIPRIAKEMFRSALLFTQ
jgi:hypothetical protein